MSGRKNSHTGQDRFCANNSGFEPVVITGMGLATAVGCTEEAVVAALRHGDTGLQQVTVGGEIRVIMGKVERLPCEMREGNRLATGSVDEPDRALAFAVHSAQAALKSANLEAADIDWSRMATVVGSSKGRVGNFLPGANGRGQLQPLVPSRFSGDTLGLDLLREIGQPGGVILNCPAACATGIVCLIRAVHALQHGEADMALAGSAESAGRALLLAAFQNMGALSPGAMRPFHAERCGFNPGEGGAVFVLERESDARRRGADILARISGWDQRSDASHITAADESGDVVAYAIRRSLKRAGWSPAEVDYCNAHGTATPLNDLVEGRAIANVFGADGPPVSALKPYIGHLLGGSSAVELAMVLAAARRGYAAPTPKLDRVDPLIPLRIVPPGGQESHFRHILKLSLGFGGHIGVIALEVV